MRQVIALGGNALLKRGEIASAENHRRNIAQAAGPLVRACEGVETALVHGNGPQIGLLALQALAYAEVPAYPLDVLGAEAQGMIGYLLAQALGAADPQRAIIGLLTQTLVDGKDAAFARPTKPIGPIYPQDQALSLAAARGWSFTMDGAGQRRVVASPAPLEVVEQATIEALVADGALVICAGGGGTPVTRDEAGGLRGVEAVIDKDLVAALLAIRLGADRLIILTDVDAIYGGWGGPAPTALREVRAADLVESAFAEGSMRPKVRAARQFIEATGHDVLIGALDDLAGLLDGTSGTRLVA
ncbi:carbamate kinase [Caulobacter sp. 1776]|uniref:carbamate kinase n=1 Tax=Caulobacter sp. 1776 TaxID=3156420 RepID=UPI003399E516